LLLTLFSSSFSQTIIAEDELTRTSWVDEIQKCISLCGPNNSSIQQSSGKVIFFPKN